MVSNIAQKLIPTASTAWYAAKNRYGKKYFEMSNKNLDIQVLWLRRICNLPISGTNSI